MNFGRIQSYVLFGGGPVLANLARHLRDRRRDALVVTSRRHALATLGGADGSTTFLDDMKRIGVPTVVTADVEAHPSVLDAMGPRALGLSAGSEWIFSRAFIEKWNGRLVNLHGSRLPRMRGGGGFSWMILLNERRSGSSIHIIEPGIDTGAIVASREYRFPKRCRIPVDFQSFVRRENDKLLRDFIDAVEAKREFRAFEQDENQSTYWPRLSTDQHGYIDWSWNAEEIDRFICAFDEPYRGASTFLKERRVRIKGSAVSKREGRFHPFQSGLIFRKLPGVLYVAGASDAITVRSVMDETGHSLLESVRVGDRFWTPQTELEHARQLRAVVKAQAL